MIVAAVAGNVLAAAAEVPGVELRGLDGRLDDVEFLVPEWGTAPDLAAMPALRVVQALSAGTDWLTVPEGVTLCNARGARDIPVAEWIVGAVLGAFSGLLWAAGERRWEHRPPRELHAARVLIVGHGSIGRATAARLEALGAHVTGVGRAARGELGRLVGEADVVVNLVPLNPDSRGMFDAQLFGAMRDGALFVNAGRGGTVDQAALLEAVPRIAAVLDVADPEPLPADHPLWSAPGVLAITGHHAGDSAAADVRCVALAVENLRAYVDGRPLRNVVGAM
jgi:phosphoglycerate dehydrogenase-like enzyme